MTKADKEGQRKTPILRFKGFTDDWEQRKLGEISETYSGGTPKVSIKSFYNKKEIPFIRSSDIHKNTTELYITKEGLEESSAKLVSKGQILYALYGATSGEVDISKIDGAINQAILAINTHDNINYFIMLFLNKNKDKIIKKYIQGGQGNLSAKIVKNININITSKKEEKEISTFIKKFEKIFTLYERKTRLLSKLRTFLTQRLFSNSSKVSLYFDNKNWSKHKISEFLTERNEKVIPNPSIPLVSFTVEKGVTPKSKRYNREFLVKDDKKKYKITKKNDIVYNPANLKFGAIARNKFGNAAFSPIYVTFITKLNPVFTEFLVHRKDFIKLALKYQEGTVYERMAVKSKDFLSLKIYLPNSSRDINHIAQILQSLDTLVSLNKNKISLITLIKKELLNTMFI